MQAACSSRSTPSSNRQVSEASCCSSPRKFQNPSTTHPSNALLPTTSAAHLNTPPWTENDMLSAQTAHPKFPHQNPNLFPPTVHLPASLHLSHPPRLLILVHPLESSPRQRPLRPRSQSRRAQVARRLQTPRARPETPTFPTRRDRRRFGLCAWLVVAGSGEQDGAGGKSRRHRCHSCAAAARREQYPGKFLERSGAG